MQTHRLVCHPDTPSVAVDAIVVEVDRSIDCLHVKYQISGATDDVRWPAPADPAFTDGLWRHTCFEAFCQTSSSESYREVNLSPSGHWAVYDFAGYRRGMTRAARQPVRQFRARPASIQAVIDIGPGNWTVGLAAVIEALDGSKSYWALKHPAGSPDFHARDCFALELPAPDCT